VLKMSGEGAIGRPHIAAALLKEELIYSFREAFEKYIGYDSPAYVEKMTLVPREVFRLILDAGGLPVLAHPGITSVDERIPEFIRDGLAGIEVYHSEHTVAARRHYLKYCQKNGLAFTGGSDFHSSTHMKSELGTPRVPYGVVDSLKEKYRAVFNRDVDL
jgi:predicted metal-dependent phosphoesterase TrpH